MADRYTNLPGLPMTLVDGFTILEEAPSGPIVAVLGSGSKGPSRTASAVLSPSVGMSRFGPSGSLGRGIAEAFQGGATGVVGVRMFSTTGKLEHVGDDSGVAGMTIEPVLAGSDALSNYSILYNQVTDELKIYEVSSGSLVYSKTGDVVAVNTGVVSVTGEAVNAVGTTPKVFGSIGKQIAVCTDETEQLAAIDVGTHRIFTFDAGIAGLNLGKLQFVDSTATPIMLQVRSEDGTVLIEEPVSAVNVASRTATIATAVDAAYFTEGVGGDGVAAVIDGVAQAHEVRFISLTQPIALDSVKTNRLIRVSPATTTEVLETPGSNFNGLPFLLNSDGVRVDADLAEVEPHKMNLYEALDDSSLVLESANIDYLVPMDAYFDDLALDGQTSGLTVLPTTEALGLVMDSAVNGSAGIDSVTCTTLAGRGDRAQFDFADGTERDLATTKLATAGRGNCWVVFSTAKSATFGEFRESDEIVRTARILNWENADANSLILHFDRSVGFSFVDANEVVEGGLNPAFKIYDTDLLFFHRSQEVNGALVHYWYTSKSDPEGNTYHEVNFAYRLATLCHDLTENEIGVLGVIGVKPPTNHFNPAAISAWVGQLPTYDSEGDVTLNGTGLLGNKFLAGYGLNGLYTDVNQFDPGFKATASDQLDDEEVVQDSNGFDIDLGKYLSIVASWPFVSNVANGGASYLTSGAALYAGMLGVLAPWRGSTAKRIGGTGIRLPVKLPKRHLNALAGLRYVLFAEDSAGAVTVVDGPTSSLPTSDFTRNMTMRLVFEVMRRLRRAARPFLGESLTPITQAALETRLKKELSDVQRMSEGALEQYFLSVTQTAFDKRLGTARVALSLKVVNELRRLSFSLSLSL